MRESNQHWVLWDGDCGFCQHSINWIKARDRQNRLYPMPYQAAPSPPMTPELATACAKAVHVITADGRVLAAGKAFLFLAEQIGWGGIARLLRLPPFLWAVELAYKIVAANRQLFSRLLFPRAGEGAACQLPTKPTPRAPTE